MIANKNEFGGSHLNFIIWKPIVSPSGLHFIVFMQGGLEAGEGTGRAGGAVAERGHCLACPRAGKQVSAREHAVVRAEARCRS